MTEMETKAERLNSVMHALAERVRDQDEVLALHWAFALRSAALFLEGAPQELFEAARRRFESLEEVRDDSA